MKMVIFDLDGVLVDIDSSWKRVHAAFGVDNEVNFQKYLKGKIDFKEFMRSDIHLWNKPKKDQIAKILDKVPLMCGSVETVMKLKKNGYRIAIISSGISILADRVKEELGIDYSYANKLLIGDNGRLTGEGEEVVALIDKETILKRLAKAEGIATDQCAVIGDSKFDISLFKNAGLSIAFNAKDDLVKETVDLVIDGKDLRKILPWLSGKERIAKAEFSIVYRGEKEAKSIVKSISPDNKKVPFGLIVKARRQGRKVNVKILCIRGVKTFLATIDDLLSCIQVAEGVLSVVEGFP